MTFDDPAFQHIPWAHPLSDPRKAAITVRQLVNHTSGIVGEYWQIPGRGVRNQGPWQWVLGHSGDWRTARLQFDPGTDLEYSTHAFFHASLLCEGLTVTGQPYDAFTIRHLFEPLGIERWRFASFDGDAGHGRHPSHALSLPAREMARVAYCMLRGGRWSEAQVVPRWFVRETGMATHDVSGTKTFGREAQSFSHGWELPAKLAAGGGIPADARFKPGTGGQLISFVPSLDLVVVRMTGGSGGEYPYEENVRRACEAVVS
jgi:CubicO group peptidase (beta-lactamase class C family)